MFSNVVPVDSGDGLEHFFIAQATWTDPIYFIHHWGKPLFSFFASPFAQFGLNGIVLFNIGVFISSCWIARLLMNHLNVPNALQLLFPLLLLTIEDYSMTILAGLTEPFFNLLVLLSALLLVRKKWILFAIVVSFLPFARSEGQLPIILGLMLLLYSKQYKAIPFLAAGFIFYGFIGSMLGSDFWWYFNNSPYEMDNSIYGSGSWNHYLLLYKNYIGHSGLVVLIVGTFTWIYFLIQRKWEYVQLELWFYATAIFIGVVASHSYFWATGQNGSIGLTRLATQGMPLFLLINLALIGRWNWSKNQLFYVPSMIICVMLGISVFSTNRYPQLPNVIEKQLISAKHFIEPHLKKDRKVFYYFPFFGYLMNENRFLNEAENITQKFVLNDRSIDLDRIFKKGDFIVWDSHFGPKEMGMSLELIEEHKELVLVNEFVSGLESVKVYQYIPLRDQLKNNVNAFIDLPNVQLEITKADEFTNVLPELPYKNENLELELTFFSSTSEVDLVFDNGIIEEYYSEKVEPNDSLNLTFHIPALGESKLYVWNPRKTQAKIALMQCKVRKISYPKVQ